MKKSTCFTTKVDPKTAPKLIEDLKAQGFEISKPAYTIFSAKKKGVSCTLYESGSLTVQGSEMEAFIEFYLEPEVLQEFRFTHPVAHLDLTPHIGMDEAGKGDFFGPLCVAAVYADGPGIQKLQQIGVKDSKRFSDISIQKVAKLIREEFSYTVIRLFPLKYNELHLKFKNLNRLLAWAHVACLSDMVQKTSCKDALLDQFAEKHVMELFLKQKKLEINFQQRVRAEEDLVVAAASILARTAFLEGMARLSEETGIVLPKGAGKLVFEVGKKIFAESGTVGLSKVAKTHFKTFGEITCSSP